jgi:hypothetical protein
MLRLSKPSILLVAVLSLPLAAKPAEPNSEKPKWVQELGYQADDVQSITLNSIGVPEILIKVDGMPVRVEFDTGNSGPLTLTTAVEKSTRYELVGQREELNPDGTHRGWSEAIKLKNVEILGTVYKEVVASLLDWKLTSDSPFNGLVGLKYLLRKRLTLDYKNRLLAITDKPLPRSIMTKPAYAITPLLKAPEQQGEIVYVSGEVNGHKQTIYLDTGTVPSCVSPEAAAGAESNKSRYHDFFKSGRKYKSIEVKIGSLLIRINDIYESKAINRGTNFEYPVGLVLGSDKLKDLIMTIDKIEGKLILKGTN